jgi:hypothetical protein
VPTDIARNRPELALPLGFVDVKVCAVDDTWSGSSSLSARRFGDRLAASASDA